MNMFRQKTLYDTEEEEARLDAEISLAKKKAILVEIKRKAGAGGWKLFSDNGKKSGIDWQKALNWLGGKKKK